MRVALPMYLPADLQAVERLWLAVRELLMQHEAFRGQTLPAQLDWPADYLGHWRAPDLLLSQSCGYPLTHALRGQVQLLGAFSYDVPGERDLASRSQIVVRRTDTRSTLAAYRGSRVAYNSTDSQSGYHALRALVAPLAEHGVFFGSSLETGAHLRSLDAVRQGNADLAALDAVTWALALDTTPALGEELRVLTESEPYPGLPLITARSTPAATRKALVYALEQVATAPAWADVRKPLRIGGFIPLQMQDYAACTAMEARAQRHGLTHL